MTQVVDANREAFESDRWRRRNQIWQSEPLWLLAETENGKSRHLEIFRNCWKLLITHAHVEASMANTSSEVTSVMGYSLPVVSDFSSKNCSAKKGAGYFVVAARATRESQPFA